MAKANSDVVDRVSELPEHLLHHIMSFIPVKDAARTSLLSKRWNRIWETLPYLDFGKGFFKGCDYSQLLLESAIKIVLSRCQHIARIEKLNFWINEISKEQWLRKNKPLDVMVERLISCVSHRALKELYFTNLNSSYYGFFNLPCTIRSAKSLNVLHLCGFDLRTLSSLDLKFPSLRELHLSDVLLGDNVMEKIIAGCLSLEDLELYRCKGAKTIYVTGLLKLKELVVQEFDGELLEIEAPCLQVLEVSYPLFSGPDFDDMELLEIEESDLIDLSPSCQVNVAPTTCSSLRKLALNGEFVDEEWLRHFIPQCLFLENLTLTLGSRGEEEDVALENVVRISSNSLKNLYLFTRSLKVEITAPNLEIFQFESCNNLLPTILLNASDLLEVELELRLGISHNCWCHPLAKFLEYFNHFNTVKLSGGDCWSPIEAIIISKESRLSMLSPLYGTRNLIFSFAREREFEIVELLEYMLWLSPRATTLSIEFTSREKMNAVLKLHYRGNVHKYSLCPLCKCNDCWHQSLSEVIFEKFEGNEGHRRKMEGFFLKHVKDLKFEKVCCNVPNLSLPEPDPDMPCLKKHKASKLKRI